MVKFLWTKITWSCGVRTRGISHSELPSKTHISVWCGKNVDNRRMRRKRRANMNNSWNSRASMIFIYVKISSFVLGSLVRDRLSWEAKVTSVRWSRKPVHLYAKNIRELFKFYAHSSPLALYLLGKLYNSIPVAGEQPSTSRVLGGVVGKRKLYTGVQVKYYWRKDIEKLDKKTL